MIASFVSTLLMMASIFIGGSVHRIFRGKKEDNWNAPEWLGFVQVLIINGIIYGIIANIVGQTLNWGWLIAIGSILSSLFGMILVFDLLYLVVLSTIHGKFELME